VSPPRRYGAPRISVLTPAPWGALPFLGNGGLRAFGGGCHLCEAGEVPSGESEMDSEMTSAEKQKALRSEPSAEGLLGERRGGTGPGPCGRAPRGELVGRRQRLGKGASLRSQLPSARAVPPEEERGKAWHGKPTQRGPETLRLR